MGSLDIYVQSDRWDVFVYLCGLLDCEHEQVLELLESEEPTDNKAHLILLEVWWNNDFLTTLISTLHTFNYIIFNESYAPDWELDTEEKLTFLCQQGVRIYGRRPKLHTLFELAHLQIRKTLGQQNRREVCYARLRTLPLPSMMLDQLCDGLMCYC